jgi:hypothetical protein
MRKDYEAKLEVLESKIKRLEGEASELNKKIKN